MSDLTLTPFAAFTSEDMEARGITDPFLKRKRVLPSTPVLAKRTRLMVARRQKKLAITHEKE